MSEVEQLFVYGFGIIGGSLLGYALAAGVNHVYTKLSKHSRK